MNDAWSRLTYVVGYPDDARADVWRLSFLVRFKDRLYAGIQEYSPRDPNDFVVFAPPPDATRIAAEHVHGARVTPSGGADTLRWYADRGTLYWIAVDRRTGAGRLYATRDGDAWNEIPLAGAGRPSDIVRWKDALVVLAEKGLFHLREDGSVALLASAPDADTFAVDDILCAPPLAVYQGDLYAGASKAGALYRLAPVGP
jgi:hypothetical protein